MMYIFKCKCGCMFTINSFKRDIVTHPKCQNCGAAVSIFDEIEQAELFAALDKSGMTMQSVPDNAKITVTFDI